MNNLYLYTVFIFDESDPETGQMISLNTSSSYDRIPYEGFAVFQTHPDHLAALARVFEVSPPEVETCRVLEVGCARGDNLIPMAVSLPRGSPRRD